MSNLKAIWRALCARKSVAFSMAILAFFVLIAIFAPVIAPYDPNKNDLINRLAASSFEHWLGTDEYGRDVLTRLMYGARLSLVIAFVSVLLGGGIGMILGMIAGYFGGVVDALIMRVTDAMMAFPQIVFALGLGAALGQGTFNLILAIGISSVPPFIRVMRSEVKRIRNLNYITAARVIGNNNFSIMFKHVVPNCVAPVIVTATMGLGGSIMSEAGLSFLGLGITLPQAAWGSMVSSGMSYLITNPLFALTPGICITIVVLAFNVFGDGLRDAMDVRIRSSL